MKKVYLLLVVCALFANMFAQKKAGFLNVAASISVISDDDEKAAAQWFTATYGGDYIPVSQIGKIDLSQYSVIWIYADNEKGYADAPDAIYAVAETLNNYYKNGGNLLLTIYANNLLYEFGRTDMWPNVTEGGAGIGAVNKDVWLLTPSYGTWDPTKTVIDRSNDPIFDGLTNDSVTRDNGNKYVVFPLIGNGWKENHNCFWSMDIADAPLNNDNIAKLTTWESTLNVTALGSWGQVQDYFGAAIARWKPTTTYKGTCITIGIGAYEWNIKNGTNPYQTNIERITRNALDELKGTQTSLKNITDLGIKIIVSNNILTVKDTDLTNKISLYNINGVHISSFDATSASNGINISFLSKGVYIIKILDNAGKSIAAQRFIK